MKEQIEKNETASPSGLPLDGSPRKMDLPPRKISWSQLSMLTRCGQQYAFRYIDGMRRPPGRFLVRGTGTHSGVELNMAHKIAHDLEPAPKDAVKDSARDAVLVTIDREGLALNDEDAAKGVARVKGEIVDSAVRLAELHYDELAPSIEPVSIERKWEVSVPSMGIILTGRMDIETPLGVRDTKTASKSPAKNAADVNDQLTMYALAYRVLNGRMPEILGLDFLVDKARADFVSQHTIRTETDCALLLKRIGAFLRVVDTGAFMPASRGDWMCSKEWCGYWEICPYV